MGYWDLEIATNRVVWTEELYAMLGLDSSQPPPDYTAHSRLFTPESWARLNASLGRTRDDGIPYDLELEFIRPDGSRGWMQAMGEAVRAQDGTIRRLQGVALEITSRKTAEEEERFWSEYLQIVAAASTALAGAPDDRDFSEAIEVAIQRLGALFGADRSYLFQFSPDLKRMTNTHEWCAAGVAPARARMQDVPTEPFDWWMARMKAHETVHYPDIASLPPEAAAVRAEMESQGVQSVICLPTSGRSGLLTGFLGFDMTRRRHAWPEDQVLMLGIVADSIGDAIVRRRAEVQVRESEERWQFALEGSGDGVWDWNAQTNRVFFSRRWKTMLGYEEDEVEDSLDEWDKRVHPEDKEACYADLRRHFDGETLMYVNEHRVLCKDGTYKWILDRGKVVSRTPDGKPLRVIGTHTDVTERRKAQEEEAFRLRREASVGRVAAAVAHEINNPLGTIKFLLRALGRAQPAEDSARDLGMLDDQVQRIAATTRALLGFSRQRNLPDHPQPVAEVIGSVIELFRGGLEARGIGVVTEMAPDLPRMVGDIGAFQEVLINLLENARTILGSGSRIALDARRDGALLVLRYRDDGPGLGPDPDRVFKPFISGRPGGTGLGLAISRATCELSGGRMIGENAAGQGAVFTMEFPVRGEGPDGVVTVHHAGMAEA